MKKLLLFAAALLTLVAVADVVGSTTARARGGGGNIMNSPGYQRRLQESRGYVTVESNGPQAVVAPHRKARHHRRH